MANNLNEAYELLEANAIDEKHAHHLSDIFKNVRDKYFNDKQEVEAKTAQYEIDFLSFNIHDNKLSFLFAGTNDKGDPFEYPSLALFTEETFEYLLKRQKEATSPLLKAKYSHILWLSPKKKIEFAQTAIQSYLELIPIREKQDGEKPKDHYGLQVLEIIGNAFHLALSVNYKVDEVKSEILRVVKNYSFESSSASVIRFRLIDLMLKHKNIFSAADFGGIIPVCEKVTEKLYGEKNKHAVIDMYELICKVEEKLEVSTEPWRRKVAEMWEELSYDREDETNLVSTEFCKNAIKHYKILKDTAKVSELEKRFDYLRKNLTLSQFGQEFDLTEMIKGFRQYADELSSKEPFAIIASLINDYSLLPTFDDIEKQAKEHKKSNPLMFLASTSIIDRYGNHSQYFSTDEEQEYYAMLWHYNLSLQISKNHLIREIIFTCVRNQKLTATTILHFLKNYSWLGKELQMQTRGDRMETYSWLNLIAPALNDYFVQLEFFFRNPSNIPNLVLCIDSLTLKIEGMLRDICEFNGVITYELRNDKKGRTISQEKDIHKLLYEEEIKKLFDKNDLLFFKFLLVEKAGYNLRHKVAHSLMTFPEYNINYMNLLVLAILKFGKYDFVPRQGNGNEKPDEQQ